MSLYRTKHDLWMGSLFNKLLPAGSMIVVVGKTLVTVPRHWVMYVIVGPMGTEILLFDHGLLYHRDPADAYFDPI